MPTRSEIAAQIDHTVLNPTSPHQAFVDACDYAVANHCASVCICPFFVRECSDLLRGSGVAVCTVIGFPHGTHSTEAKVAEARIAMEDGAAELDMVVNVSKCKDGDWDYVERDIAAVCRAVHGAGRLLKVIFECCFLSDEEKIRLCEICTRVGADFVKTSTGYGSGGATVADIALMKAHVGPGVQIKAAGGIHTAEELLALRAAGADRFGCSRTEAILAGIPG
jgi:deoxyribose-phosphate aldolase